MRLELCRPGNIIAMEPLGVIAVGSGKFPVPVDISVELSGCWTLGPTSDVMSESICLSSGFQ